jgi:hypothetical protein
VRALAAALELSTGLSFDFTPMDEQVCPLPISIDHRSALIDGLEEQQRNGIAHSVEARHIDFTLQATLQSNC